MKEYMCVNREGATLTDFKNNFDNGNYAKAYLVDGTVLLQVHGSEKGNVLSTDFLNEYVPSKTLVAACHSNKVAQKQGIDVDDMVLKTEGVLYLEWYGKSDVGSKYFIWITDDLQDFTWLPFISDDMDGLYDLCMDLGYL